MRRLLGLSAVFLLSFSLAAGDDKKKDPDEIGNRDVGKGMNWYSLEKEIALGKALAQDVEQRGRDGRHDRAADLPISCMHVDFE